MTRICGWLAQEIGDRSPLGSEFSITMGRGGADQIDALLAGEADIAIVTPTPAALLLRDGSGPASRPPAPSIRSLGVVGQRDRLVAAVDAALPIYSVADLAGVAEQLAIGTSPDDGVNAIGLAVHYGLSIAGDSADLLRENGATFRYDERPFPVVNAFAGGELNVVITEAIMMPAWQRIASQRPVRYLEWGDDVLAAFAAIGWPSATVEQGYLPMQDEDLLTLDFSDFVILCRDDLDDEVAHMATWCMIKTRLALESQYAHFPQDKSPVTYPLDPATMRQTPIPLHDSARRAYDELASAQPLSEGLLWK